MTIDQILKNDTFDTWRTKYNSFATIIGDIESITIWDTDLQTTLDNFAAHGVFSNSLLVRTFSGTGPETGFRVDYDLLQLKWADRDVISDVLADLNNPVSNNAIATSSAIKSYVDSTSLKSVNVDSPLSVALTPDFQNPTISLNTDAVEYLKWEIGSSPVTAAGRKGYLIDVSGSAATINAIPSPSIGDTFGVAHFSGDISEVYNISINGNGNNIMGETESLVLDKPYQCVILTYSGAAEGWVISTATTSVEFSGSTPFPVEFYFVKGYDYELGPLNVGNNRYEIIMLNPGVCTDNSGTTVINLTIPINKICSQPWAAGDGGGGLLGGSWSANSVYNIFLMKRSDGEIDFGVQTEHEPSIPSAWQGSLDVVWKWVGFFVTDSSSGIIPFFFRGDTFYFLPASATIVSSSHAIPADWTILNLVPWLPEPRKVKEVSLGLPLASGTDTTLKTCIFGAISPQYGGISGTYYTYNNIHTFHLTSVSGQTEDDEGNAWGQLGSVGDTGFIPIMSNGSIMYRSGDGVITTNTYSINLKAVRLNR